jgi:hypothetical protein
MENIGCISETKGKNVKKHSRKTGFLSNRQKQVGDFYEKSHIVRKGIFRLYGMDFR